MLWGSVCPDVSFIKVLENVLRVGVLSSNVIRSVRCKSRVIVKFIRIGSSVRMKGDGGY